MTDTVIQFTVEGEPAPGGSKSAFPFKRTDGKLGVRVKDASPRNSEWRNHVAAIASVAMDGRQPLDGPIHAQAFFRLAPPKSDPDRTIHTIRPDATKLWRAVEDALTGIVWHDDAQVVTQHVAKSYAFHDSGPGVTVTVYPASDSWCPKPGSLPARDRSSHGSAT